MPDIFPFNVNELRQLTQVSFAYPSYVTALIILIPIWITWHRRRRAVGHSNLSIHSGLRGSSLLGLVPIGFLSAAAILGVLALMGPRLPEHHTKEIRLIRDFMIFVDISGSMRETLQDAESIKYGERYLKAHPRPKPSPDAQSSTSDNEITKTVVAQAALTEFVSLRKGDRVGLGRFDDNGYYSCPLTDDLEHLIIPQIEELHRHKGGGTEFDGERGPIQLSLNHFKSRDITPEKDGASSRDREDDLRKRTKVIVLITDGEATMKEERTKELKKQIVAGRIHLYILGIGTGWKEESSSTEPLRNFVKQVGGKVIPVANVTELRKGLLTINRLEKSPVEIEQKTTQKDVSRPFIVACIAFLAVHLLTCLLFREDAF